MTVMGLDGAPPPVAWTRMRGPQLLMAAIPEGSLRPGVALSVLMARYGREIARSLFGTARRR